VYLPSNSILIGWKDVVLRHQTEFSLIGNMVTSRHQIEFSLAGNIVHHVIRLNSHWLEICYITPFY